MIKEVFMNTKLKIGEKIKKRRNELKMTQKELCGDKITRNMLSLIESGSAFPSLDTALYLAKRLEISPEYLFSEYDNDFIYTKQKHIDKIRELYKQRKYFDCIEILSGINGTDDELSYIAAHSFLYLGIEKAKNGSLLTASEFLSKALSEAQKTIYDTSKVKIDAPLYLAIAENIQAPLLEFDSNEYETLSSADSTYEYYKYILMDAEYDFKTPEYKKHLTAKLLLKKYAYNEAISLLTELESIKDTAYDAYMLFGVYSDLENAYRQTGDFENAYRYSAKRMSLINGFKS